MAQIIFHVQGPTGTPIGGALLSATSPSVGPWQGLTNPCGDFVADLAPATYDVLVSKDGFQTRPYTGADAMHIADCGMITIGLASGGHVLPAIPTREQVCSLRTSLQGLTYHTTQFGPIPAWFYAALVPADRAIARVAHRAAGDTHIIVPISEAYRESGTLWPEELKQGYDYTSDLDALRAILTEVISDGFFVDLPLAGDGLSTGTGYNDPVGRTYGYEWLLSNLTRIITSLRGDGTPERPDLTPYILFRPGWDAVFYGWGRPGEVPDQQPTRVNAFGRLFRSLLPQGYLAIEHTPGNIPCGEGGSDYAPGGLMCNYDTILSEFASVHEDSCWQVVGRMVRPYHRPADQPAGDDPNPPFYLAPGTDRGPYYYVAFEPTIGGVYQWCRGQCTLAEVNATRDYLRALGCTLVG